MSVMGPIGEFGDAKVAFAFPGQRIPPEMQIEFELLRATERPPAVLEEWAKRLERHLQRAATPQPWSVLRVSPNMERKVAAALGPKTRENPHGAGLMVYVPIEKYRPRRTWKSRTRPLIPGYIFILLRGDDDLDTARGNYAVREVMCRDGRPIKIPAIDIGSMILAESLGAFDQTWKAPPPLRDKSRGRRPTRYRWQKGERVRVEEGPFAGFLGEVVNAERADRIELIVSLFGRATPVSLDEEMIEKLG